MRASSRVEVEKVWTALAGFRRSRVGRSLSRAFALAILAFLGVRLWRLWSSTDLSLHDVRPGVATAAVVVSAIAVASYGCVWLVVLRRLGFASRATQLTFFLSSQLGKYIPGSVWQYAGRIGFGRSVGITADIGLASVAVEVAASLSAALIIGSFVLSLWVAAAAIGVASVVIVAAGSMTVRPPPGLSRRSLMGSSARAIPRVVPLYGVVWLLYGVAFWLTARALFVIPASDLLLYVGVFALSWSVGFVVIFAPGGVGVREAVIVALLAGHLGEARAIVLAGASRLVLTAIDLVLGGIAVASTKGPARTPGLEAQR